MQNTTQTSLSRKNEWNIDDANDEQKRHTHQIHQSIWKCKESVSLRS